MSKVVLKFNSSITGKELHAIFEYEKKYYRACYAVDSLETDLQHRISIKTEIARIDRAIGDEMIPTIYKWLKKDETMGERAYDYTQGFKNGQPYLSIDRLFYYSGYGALSPAQIFEGFGLEKPNSCIIDGLPAEEIIHEFSELVHNITALNAYEFYLEYPVPYPTHGLRELIALIDRKKCVTIENLCEWQVIYSIVPDDEVIYHIMRYVENNMGVKAQRINDDIFFDGDRLDNERSWELEYRRTDKQDTYKPYMLRIINMTANHQEQYTIRVKIPSNEAVGVGNNLSQYAAEEYVEKIRRYMAKKAAAENNKP